jgi:putative phosphotransacetylase
MAMVLDRQVVENVVREVLKAQIGRPQSAPQAGPGPKIVVNASARHMHLTQTDLEKLFGPGVKLTVLRPLYQEGHFAAEQTVTLIGPRQRVISNLRILGPVREYTQIELASTDTISLGIENVPARESGDIQGSPGAYVMGPAGMLELKEGVIRAAIHAHLSPAEAVYFGVQDKEFLKLQVKGDACSVTFDRVLARVNSKVKLEVHMDTDEANACDLPRAREIRLFR